MIIVQVKDGESIEKALKALGDQPQEDDEGCIRTAAPRQRGINPPLNATRHHLKPQCPLSNIAD